MRLNKDNAIRGTVVAVKTETGEIFNSDELCEINSKNVETFLAPRTGLNFMDKAFYLEPKYDWSIVKDSGGNLVLVPTKQK